MKSLVEFIKESMMIGESLKSLILRDLSKQLKSDGIISFKKLIGDKYRIEMSKVEDDDFKVFKNVKFTKDLGDFLLSLIKGIAFENEEYIAFVREPNNGEFLWYIDLKGNFYRFGKNYPEKKNQTEKKSLLIGNDLYCLPLTDENVENYNKIARQRYKDKEGSINFRPESLEKVAKENIERYKEILTKNDIDRKNISDKLIDKVYDLIDDFNKLSKEVAKKWNKYDHDKYGDVARDLAEIIRDINDETVKGYERTELRGTNYDGKNYFLLYNFKKYAESIDEKDEYIGKNRRTYLLNSYKTCKEAYDKIKSKID